MLYLLVSLIFMLSSALYAQRSMHVNIAQQRLYLTDEGKIVKRYPISTSGYGIGRTSAEQNNNKTPLGRHRIRCKIGAGAPHGTVFKTAINTKKIAPIFKKPVPQEQQQDLITTRIFQLDGLEERNRHSSRRGIWVHGTPYEGNIGTACSHGCVRMRNKDMCELYELVEPGMILDIVLK